MKKQCLLFLAAMMVCSLANAATQPWGNYTAAQATVAPKIDGTISDGEYQTDAIEMDGNTMALFKGAMLSKCPGESRPGSPTSSGRFWFTWDANYLYIAARVKDSKVVNLLNQGGALNATDGVQICLDTMNKKSGDVNNADSGLRILDLVPGQKDNPNKAAFWQHWPSEVGYPNSFGNTIFASHMIPEGYEVEMAVKWSDMGPTPPTPAIGTKIGYMTMIMHFGSATDNAALLDLWWNSGNNTNIIGDASYWNTMTLGPAKNVWNYTAAKALVPPTIDGVVNDGEYVTTPIIMNQANMAALGGSMLSKCSGETRPGSSDLEGTFWITWDENYLYVASRVQDSKVVYLLNQGGALNASDGIQFCLDPIYLKGGDVAATTTGLRIFDLLPGQKAHPTQAAFWQHWPGEVGYPNSFSSAQFAGRRVGFGYETEMAIMWADMLPTPPVASVGTTLGYMTMIEQFGSATDNSALLDLWWNAGKNTNIIGDASFWNNLTLGRAQDPWTTFTVAKTAKAPVIDGKINAGEYSGNAILMNNSTLGALGGSMLSKIPSPPCTGVPADMTESGTFWMNWDANYLYVAAHVKDSKVVFKSNQGDALNGTDGIQLCLDPLNKKSGDINDAASGLRILDLVPGQKDNPNKAAFWQHWPSEIGYPKSFANTQFASRVVSDGYEVEMAIKWSDMTPTPPNPAIGMKIGYMTLVECFGSATDNNALLDLWFNAGNNTNMIGDASQWKTAILGDLAEPVTLVPVEMSNFSAE